jgi:hypothetical protein
MARLNPLILVCLVAAANLISIAFIVDIENTETIPFAMNDSTQLAMNIASSIRRVETFDDPEQNESVFQATQNLKALRQGAMTSNSTRSIDGAHATTKSAQKDKSITFSVPEQPDDVAGLSQGDQNGKFMQILHQTTETDRPHPTTETARKEKPKRFFLTACTMVKNEAPYVVEWIEFNRLQGVDRFVLYDDGSSDNMSLLSEFYEQQDTDIAVHVLPAIAGEQFSRQQLTFQHCLDVFGNTTDWMMDIDVDEFMYSPAFGTIVSLLGNMTVYAEERNMNLTVFTSANLNFGSSGQRFRFENALVRSDDGKVQHRNGCGAQLITDHVLRGHLPLSEAYKNQTRSLGRICELPGSFSPCRHNPGKSIFSPPAVAIAGVHHPLEMRYPSSGVNWDPPLLVGNHYYYRSREDVELKASQWYLTEHVRNYNLTDDLLWNVVVDDVLRQRWGPELARRMQDLTSFSGSCVNGVGRGAT